MGRMTDKEREQERAKQFGMAKGIIEAKREEIRRACGKRMDADKLIRTSLTVLADPTNENILFKSTPESIAKTVLQFGQIELYPDPTLAYAYFVPYQGECKPSLGYKGIIHLALRCKAALSIDSQCVYQQVEGEKVEGDTFEMTMGTSPNIVHVPKWTDRTDDQKAPITWVYAVAHLPAGPPKVEVMARGQVENIRQSSMRPNGAPWARFWSQMARKTVIRRLANYLDLAPEYAQIIADDVAVEYGDEPAADAGDDEPETTEDTTPRKSNVETLAERAGEYAGDNE